MKPKMYSLGNEAQRVVNNTFDKMHMQGCLKYTTDPTLFNFPVFIV